MSEYKNIDGIEKMSLIDLFKKKEKAEELILEHQVLDCFKQSCWDLYVSNLPNPVINGYSNLPDVEKKGDDSSKIVPRGFGIDPNDGWVIYFNPCDLPKNLTPDSSLDKYMMCEKIENPEIFHFARSIFQHEQMHFLQCPYDGVTLAILIDSALKGFSDPELLSDTQRAGMYAHLTINIMSDLIIDTYLAKEGYGRNDFGDLTIWRQKETIKQARLTKQSPSKIWQIFVRSYENMWNEALGVDRYVPKMDPELNKVAATLVDILGDDWKDRTTWEEKAGKFAAVLEPYLEDASNQAKTQSSKSNYKKRQSQSNRSRKQRKQDKKKAMPDDIMVQTGISGKEKNGAAPKDRELEKIYARNKDSPTSFAGTMGALYDIEPDDALRLMYRQRARNLLFSINGKIKSANNNSPSYQTSWELGDPILGPRGLQIVPSMMASGRPIPGLTTYKRRYDPVRGYGQLKSIPDLLIEIDSSGSMSWDPYADKFEERGDLDKAILAAEAAALYAIEHGSKVAVINFVVSDSYHSVDFTDDMDSIEKCLMQNGDGGTTIPIEETKRIIQSTQNPLITALISDCSVSNWEEASKAMSYTMSDHDQLHVFYISPGRMYAPGFVRNLKEKGAIVTSVYDLADLMHTVLGEIKVNYN